MSYAFSPEMLEVLGAWDTKAKNTNWRNQRRDRRGRWSNDPLMGAAEVGVLRDLGINAQAVGGAVRDQLMGTAPKDIDFVVPNMSAEELKSSLEEHGRVEDLVVADRLVGTRFYPSSGAHPEGIEVVPTRREISTGEGHQDFDIVPDSSMTLEEDMERRDFTINAMARDVETGELTDPYGGEQDLQDGVLRTVSPTSFRDDPLRIIRGLRFVSKYGLEPDPDTFQQMKDNAPGVLNVSGERIRMELDKLLMGAQPAKALELARDTGVLQYMLPEVAATIGFDQESKYHDLTLDEHIFSVVQAAADQDTPLAVRLATLFHDVGKPDSAWRGPEGRLHYYANEEHGKRSHEDVGADMARVALDRMAYSNDVKDRVIKLVQSHMFQPKTRSIQARKFIAEHGRDVATQLLAHRRADFSGKGEGELNSDSLESMDKFEEMVKEEMGQPLFISELEIDGSDITNMGLKPGPEIGNILKSLLGDVIGSPDLNNREWLLNRAGSLVRRANNSSTQGKAYENTNWRNQLRDDDTGRWVDSGALAFLGGMEGNSELHPDDPSVRSRNEAAKEELQSTWGRDMDEEQLAIMRSYTEAEGEIKPIQGFLRTGSVSEKWKDRGYTEEWATQKASELDSIMVEGSKPVVSWRGISDEAAEDLFGLESGSLLSSNELDIVGDEYRDGGFVSTSFRRGAYNTRVVLKITTPAGFKGLWAQPHSGYPNEDELILGRGSTFRVKSVELGNELNVNKPGPYWEARRGQRVIVVDVDMVDQQ